MTQDIKQLQTLLQKYKNELSNLKAESMQLAEIIKIKFEAVKNIEKEITKLTTEPQVTEHAIIRYFQRVLCYDIEEIKNKILPVETSKQIKILGDGEYPVSNFSVRSKNNMVITVITEK